MHMAEAFDWVSVFCCLWAVWGSSPIHPFFSDYPLSL